MEDSKELRTMLRMKSFGCNVYSPRLSLVFASLPPPLISRGTMHRTNIKENRTMIKVSTTIGL